MINYAHRGASEYAPENTFSSFYLGLLQGANGIETGNIPNNGTLSYTPSNVTQNIPAGYTSGGTISAMDITTTSDYSRCLDLSKSILGIE